MGSLPVCPAPTFGSLLPGSGKGVICRSRFLSKSLPVVFGSAFRKQTVMKTYAPLFAFSLIPVGFAVVVLLGNPNMVKAGDRQTEISDLVKAADLIVVARVIGLIDTKPIARSRPHREPHWIHVERTLEGYDETGHRLRVRPNPLPWKNGKSYVLFLNWLGSDWSEAIPQELVEATDESITTVVNEIAAQGRGMQPMRALWMRYTGGWGGGVLSEFSVTGDGHFEWNKRIEPGGGALVKYEQRIGKLPEDALSSLIRQVAEAGLGPSADDSGQVAIRWLDAKGEALLKGYSRPDLPPASDLLETVEALARKHGQTPTLSSGNQGRLGGQVHISE